MRPFTTPQFKPMRSLALLASVCGFLCTGAPTNAAIVLTISDGVGSPNIVDLDPSVPSTFNFAFDVFVTITLPDTGITGLTYLLQTPDLTDSGLFRITSRNTTGGLFTGSTLTTPDSTVLIAANALLDTRNNNDLGGTVVDPLTECIPPGTYFLATYTFNTNSAISPGIHSIQDTLVSATGCGPGFDEIPIASTSYSVNVVPEPSTGLLLGVGLMILGRARRRRI